MRKCVFIVPAIAVWLSCVVCFGEEAAKPPAEAEETKVAPVKLPAVGKVLDWQELLRFVPKPPKGWKATKPVGATNRPGPFAVSKVSTIFRRGAQRIQFRLEDLGSNNPYLSMEEPWKPVEKKTEDKWSKKLMLGKVAAEECFWPKKKWGLIFLVFEKRIQLNIIGSGMEDTSTVVELAKTINFKELKKAMEEKSK